VAHLNLPKFDTNWLPHIVAPVVIRTELDRNEWTVARGDTIQSNQLVSNFGRLRCATLYKVYHLNETL